ncbi:MAG: hypothetical protein WCP12_04605 [bacterium]
MRTPLYFLVVLLFTLTIRVQAEGFAPDGKGFRVETPFVSGALHAGGASKGLFPLVETRSGMAIAGENGYGIFSHYRLLSATDRYGTAGWDWASTTKLNDDGSVEISWSSDKEHPFDMKAVYAWKGSNTLDLLTCVTPKKNLKKMEVFLASYFQGFPQAWVYAKQGMESGFMEAVERAGIWQAFPRDTEAVSMLQDGRWTRPPHPVEWSLRPALAAPLAMRRDSKSGLCALVMALPEDCFAVLTPYSEESHRSLYLSLFGRDMLVGETVQARTRFIVGHNISDDHAVQLYQTFQAEMKKQLIVKEEKPKPPFAIPCDISACGTEQKPTALDGMTLQEVADFRVKCVKRHQALGVFPADYNPLQGASASIYNGIASGEKWVGVSPYYIANPYFLVNLAAANQVTPLNVLCPDVSLTYTKSRAEERHSGETAKAFFNAVYSDQFTKPGKVRLMLVNAYDAGFHYATVDLEASVNIDPEPASQNICSNIYSRAGYYHRGRYGKNNLSPEDKNAWLVLKQRDAYTKIELLLWKQNPLTRETRADLHYAFVIDPGK